VARPGSDTHPRGGARGSWLKRLERAARLGLCLTLLCAALPSVAAVPVDVLRVDMQGLIRGASTTPSQFAVPVPHPVSQATDGTWTVSNSHAQWHYTAQVPTAVSLSFFAAHVRLPPSATLSVRGGPAVTHYRARDLHEGALWSRISPGDLLELTLDVAASERSAVVLQIAMFQAGYRSLGAGVADHPYFRQLKLASAASGAGSDNSVCVQNYGCALSSTNSGPAQATVGLVVGNLYQCTGTLINDVPGDNTPYVLTARHCQTGKLGGGNPGAAATITVYWNAMTACGQALGSLYDPNVPVQTGAASLVEQQDAWLVRLDASPVVTSAQFAGFDVTGATVEGGYTIHHALGFDKQLVNWRGAALAQHRMGVLGVTYASDFWDVVNAAGNSGPGASGSGLFDQGNHLVGALSLGRGTADASGYESCPVAQGAPPNGSNGTNDFTSLAAVWNSTADPTGSTATLRSVLDPQDTRTVQTDTAPAASMSLTSSLTSVEIGTAVLLSWNAPGANACMASGGVSGDRWSGSLAGSGSLEVTESTPASTRYLVNCMLPAGRTVSASVTVAWGPPHPIISLAAPATVWAGRPAQLTWSSNEAPCAITGGSLAVSGLAAAGVVTATQPSPGTVQYQITCGNSATATASTVAQVLFVTPGVELHANGTDRLLGEQFFLTWQSYADSCTPSGGAPGDGWTTTAFPDPTVPSRFDPLVAGVGTYTYTLTCFSGPVSVTKSVVVTFEQNAPYVSATVDRTSGTFTGTNTDYFNVSWNSNLSSCVLESDPAVTNLYSGSGPQDTAKIAPPPGTYTVDVFCQGNGTGVSASSAPLALTVLAPPAPSAAISVTPATVDTGEHFTVSWSSEYAGACEAAGAPVDVGWEGSQSATGSRDFSTSMVGDFTFTISCAGLWGALPAAIAQAAVTVRSPPVLAVSLTANSTNVAIGETFTLSWSSQNVATCLAGGGGASGSPWTGPLPSAGSAAQSATVAGTFTYQIACDMGAQWVEAQSTVTVLAAPAPAGGGGGGSLDLLLLAGLGARLRLRARARLRPAIRH
jgi:lysyl endopeptidase